VTSSSKIAIAGTLAGAVLLVVFGEVAARALGVIDRLNGTPRRLYERVNADALPYRLRPDTRVDLQGHEVRINDAGLRGPDFHGGDDASVERIAVLGDSVVFGVSVADEETFPSRLQHHLAVAHGRRAEVLNAGVPGYNTAAEAAFFAAFGAALAPRRVLLGVSFNDFGDTPALNAFGVMTRADHAQSPGWLAEHSELYLLVLWSWKFARGEHWFQALPDAADGTGREKFAALDGFVERNHRAFYAAPAGAKWERVGRSLAALRDRTAGSELPLTVVLFPESFQFGEDPYRAPQRAWTDLCAALGIDAIDLWPAFAAAIRAGNSDLFYDAQHPNAAGLDLAAAAVAAHLSGAAR
jgi:lysophospholipase L1-like esterase